MLKKILATALAAAMIFGLTSVAFAAAFSDTAGNAKEAAIKRLAAIGLLNGYPDGTFKPNNTISRAEFAKIMTVALGLEDSAESMKGVPSGFSDVSVDHWANGFINVAASEAIIAGYPDGTFAPDNPVNYNEAITMIMRALGWGPILKNGVWPAAYLTQANREGVTDGVAFSGPAGATRANVAALVANALTLVWQTPTEYDSNGNPTRFGDDPDEMTFLEAMGCEKSLTAILVSSPESFGNDGEHVQIEGEDEETLADGTDYAGLLGHRVVLWFNGDGDVFYVENKTSASDIKTAEFSEVDEDEVLVEIDDEDVDVAGATLILNYGDDEPIDADEDQLADGDEITVIFYDGDPISVLANRWSYGVVSSVSTSRERISFKSGDDPGLTLEDWDVTWVGGVTDLADIEEDDVVQYIKDDDEEKAVLQISSDAITGEFTRVRVDEDDAVTSVRVGGTYYDVADSFELGADEVRDMLTADVTLILDKNGDVQYMIEEEGDTETYAGVVIGIASGSAVWDDVTEIKLFNVDGDLVTLEVSSDFDFIDGGDPVDNTLGYGVDDDDPQDYADDDEFIVHAGDVIEYELDDDVIDTIEIKVLASAADTDLDVDADDDLIEWPDAGTNYKLTSNTVVFWLVEYTDDTDDLALGTVDDILDNDSIEGYLAKSSGKVTYVVVTDASALTDEAWGVVLDSWQEDDDTFGFTVLADGVETDYTTEDDVLGWGESDVVTFDPNGDEATSIEDAIQYDEDIDGYWVVASVSDDVVKLTEYGEDDDPVDTDLVEAGVQKNNIYLLVDADSLFYFDKTGSTNPVSIDLDEVTVGSMVRVYTEAEGDELLKVLVIFD